MGVYYYVINEKYKVAFLIGKHEPNADPEEVWEWTDDVLCDETLSDAMFEVRNKQISEGLTYEDVKTIIRAFDIVESLTLCSVRDLLATLLMFMDKDWYVVSEYDFDEEKKKEEGWRVIE